MILLRCGVCRLRPAGRASSHSTASHAASSRPWNTTAGPTCRTESAQPQPLKRGGRHVPSLVAEIGTVIEEHLITIGLMKRDGPDEGQQRHIDEVRRGLGCKDGEFPPDAAVCARCSTKAAVMLDGCMTCLNCGDSKCG